MVPNCNNDGKKSTIKVHRADSDNGESTTATTAIPCCHLTFLHHGGLECYRK